MRLTRNRMINLRVSEEEFERLRSASAKSGSRSLSEYSRDILLASVSGAAPLDPAKGSGVEKLLTLDLRMALVELAVARLEGRVSSLSSQKEEPVAAMAGM